ncbi:MAG: hypothetical protein PUP92_37515 [Rhizonema sp. PD38]|nr:hypothetical protein [Rhizonema sp. PD38]
MSKIILGDWKSDRTRQKLKWLKRYKQGGIDALLEVKTALGKLSLIPETVMSQLHERLGQPQGFRLMVCPPLQTLWRGWLRLQDMCWAADFITQSL